ncbi:MAG: U32 family peptidase [Candidatus Omnitrophica bacterium]|nr:U32 family peptidase [Candidatus Omnitrophota bacterium]
MQLSIPTNWDLQLLDQIDKTAAAEIYGKLAKDIIGGGRVSFALPDISRRAVKRYVEKTHRYGLRFNYLLNSTCLGNREWSRKGQYEIERLLGWLDHIGVDALTVANPYLLQRIKKRYPRFKVYVSTQTGIDTIQEARHWQDMGADRITLSVHRANRNFLLLRRLKDHVSCEVQLIVNLQCLKNCPFWLYHGNSSSHSSQTDESGNRFVVDYCFLMCNHIRLKNPEEFIRSGWIRPEDTGVYEEIGIDNFKLVNRTMPTRDIVRTVAAYTRRRYDGNLLDLFSDPSRTFVFENLSPVKKLVHVLRHFFRPLEVDVLRFSKMKELMVSPPLYIDNRALDGFIEHFLNDDAGAQRVCSECAYCKKMAQKSVTVTDENALKELIVNYEAFLESIVSGNIFYLTPSLKSKNIIE